eukprot:TRINITY_DN3535_c0_g1_i12.p1 TRINITY_DN3535_c0_g1~~TRINITY_DN3535_c0_g1_i12.p1  ORF type:complete len:168 (-),score=23.52 TRINITY_DN3535_c0_g1_i12:46-492(-)
MDKDGNNAMFYVENAAVCDWLLSHGATPHPRAYSRSIEQCAVMLRHGVDVNIVEHGATPHPLAYAGSVKQCEVMLRHGVDVNIEYVRGYNALFYVQDAAVCDWLFERGRNAFYYCECKFRGKSAHKNPRIFNENSDVARHMVQHQLVV